MGTARSEERWLCPVSAGIARVKTRHLWTYDVRPGSLFRIPPTPDNVMLDVTWSCNQRCGFCYQPALRSRRGHPETGTLVSIVRRLAQWGVAEVLYLGGEPLLHPGIEEVLQTGASLGLRQRLVTNGSRLDSALAQRLSCIGLGVGVSLHGSNARTHDALAGRPGSFELAIAALAAIHNAKGLAWVQYSPTRHNADQMISLADLLRTRFGPTVRFVDVNRLLPFGQAADEGRGLLLDEEGWWQALREVVTLATMGWEVRVESVPRCWVRRQAARDRLSSEQTNAILSALRPCWMAVTQLALDPEGRIKLCPGGPPLGPSILDMKPKRLWLEAPVLNERRRLCFLPHECLDYATGRLCGEFYECVGGCRGAAGITPHASDPLMTPGWQDRSRASGVAEPASGGG